MRRRVSARLGVAMARYLLTLTLLSASLTGWCAQPWIERSDRNSAIVFEALGAFQPEYMAYLGAERFDPQAMDLGPQVVERFDAATRALLARLTQLKAAE